MAALAFRLVDPALQITTHKVDGDVIAPGDLLMEITGDAASILSGERVALNFAGRMSGIATLTDAFVAETRGTDARVTCTRKTTPACVSWKNRPFCMAAGSTIASACPTRS
jgi:nicotinate-nucleotide pyrophosphorylase (carboxylating)